MQMVKGTPEAFLRWAKRTQQILQVNFGENPEKNYKLQKLHISVFWTKLDQTPETNQYLYSKDRTWPLIPFSVLFGCPNLNGLS